MAKKKISIIGLLLKSQAFIGVGEPIDPGGPPVEDIIFNRPDAPYNKGFQVTGASYTVRMADTSIRRVIPFSSVEQVVIDTEAGEVEAVPAEPIEAEEE